MRTGALRRITGTDPAAGVEISETVPTDKWWKLIALRFSLVTSATAANRLPTLIVDDGTDTVWSSRVPNAQTAGLTMHYQACLGLEEHIAAAAAGALVSWRLPELVLPAGYRIRTSTAAVETDDNYGAPRLLVVQYDAHPEL